MDLKTLGPGPIYEMEGRFKHGPDYPSKIMPGFNLDHRKPLVRGRDEREGAFLPPSSFILHPPLPPPLLPSFSSSSLREWGTVHDQEW